MSQDQLLNFAYISGRDGQYLVLSILTIHFDCKYCKGSFKKYVTEKIAILIPPHPHVTACHVPVDTPLRYVTFLQDTPSHYMRHIDQPLFDIV